MHARQCSAQTSEGDPIIDPTPRTPIELGSVGVPLFRAQCSPSAEPQTQSGASGLWTTQLSEQRCTDGAVVGQTRTAIASKFPASVRLPVEASFDPSQKTSAGSARGASECAGLRHASVLDAEPKTESHHGMGQHGVVGGGDWTRSRINRHAS